MRRLIEFPLEDETTILVEVDELEPEAGVVRAARPSEMIAKAHITFDQALEKVKPAASTIIKNLRNISDQPDEIEVAFGLKMSAEAGAFVAMASIEANYCVTLKWKKQTVASSH